MARIQLLKNLLKTTSVYPITTSEAVYDNNQKLSTVLTDIRDNYAKKTQICNPNLLDNAWFTVNSRGQSEYTENGYTVDRWISQWSGNGLTKIEEFGISLFKSDDSYNICQRIYIPKEMEGKTVTISAIGKGTVGVKLIKVNDDDWTDSINHVISISTNVYEDWSLIQGTVKNIISGRYVLELFTIKDVTSYFKCAKVELGEVSTLEMEPVPNYEIELYKCVTSKVDTEDTYTNKPNINELNRNLTNKTGFIDFSKKMYSKSYYNETFSYTATEDCFIVCSIASKTNGKHSSVTVEGVTVETQWGNSNSQNVNSTVCVYVKEGQIVKLENTETSSSSISIFNVFGLY